MKTIIFGSPNEELEACCEQIPGVSIAGIVDERAKMISMFKSLKPDVLVMDADWLGLESFDVVERCRPSIDPAVIFVSRRENYALRAFEVAAVDYVIKPISRERLEEAFSRARLSVIGRSALKRQSTENFCEYSERIQGSPSCEQEFWIRGQRQGLQRITPDMIESVSADGDYVKVCSNGRTLLMRETVGGMHDRLGQSSFIRVHRSTLVRCDLISEIRRSSTGRLEVWLKNGRRFPVGRVFAKRLRSRIRIS